MPPRRARGRGWGRYLGALFLALGAHAVALLLWQLSGEATALGPTTVAQASSTATVDDAPMEVQSLVDELQRPETPSAEEKKRAEEIKKEEEQKKAPGQVVDLARPAIEQRPDQSEFVSEYDSKVDHQTKAPPSREHNGERNRDPAQPTPPVVAAAPPHPVGVPTAGPAKAAPAGGATEPAETAGSPDSAELPRAVDGTLASPGRPQKPVGGALAMRPRVAGGSAALGDGSEGPVGQAAEPPRPTQQPNLTPTREMLERAVGRGSGSLDYLHDVDDGEATALNSKRWVHAVFFNRVKRAVAQEWHADIVYMAHDPTGHIYGVKDRVTVLRVHLNPDGALAGTDVVQSSGVDFLDDEAIAAFKKAAPFPNPPTALVEADGKIHFNFAFVMELSGRSSMKVYKYE